MNKGKCPNCGGENFFTDNPIYIQYTCDDCHHKWQPNETLERQLQAARSILEGSGYIVVKASDVKLMAE